MSKTNRQHDRKLDRFYNNDLLNDIMSLAEIDVLSAIEKFKEYLLHYPNDYNAHCLYASALIRVRRYEEAEKVLNDVEERYKHKNTYFEKQRDEVFYRNLSISKIKLYSYTSRFQECFSCMKANRDVLDKGDLDLKVLRHYCLINMTRGTDKYKISDETSYVYHQIIEYSEEEFKEHIKKHTLDYKLKDGETTSGVFFREFPLDKVIEEIKKYIPSDKHGYCIGFYEDSYCFKYDNCGRSMTNKNRKNSVDKNYRSKQLISDYFKVITFHNSQNIITICPCTNPCGLPYIDLNYLKEQEEPKPEKKDKVAMFYKKYSNVINKK